MIPMHLISIKREQVGIKVYIAKEVSKLEKTMKISELFDTTTTNSSWEINGNNYVKSIKINGNYIKIFIERSNIKEEEFASLDIQGISLNPRAKGFYIAFSVDGAFSKTSSQNSQVIKIFSIVVSSLKEFFTSNPWDYIWFTGPHDEEEFDDIFNGKSSREKFYFAIGEKMAKENNAKFFGLYSRYLVYKKSAIINENI